MLYFYSGTERAKARAKMGADVAKIKGAEIVRVTDAHTIDDLRAVLQGGGMFAKKRVLVFEGVCVNTELCEVFLDSLKTLSESNEDTFVFEEKPIADVRKKLAKYAKKSERFDAAKKAEDTSIFILGNALRRRDKKALWIGHLREIAKGSPPEAIHGILFWAAKTAFLSAKAHSPEQCRGAALISELAELPHAARRRGFDLEYALEKFVLSLA